MMTQKPLWTPMPVESDYWVLDVEQDASGDYQSALIYACDTVPLIGTPDHWPYFFSRSQVLDDDLATKWKSYIDAKGITVGADFVKTPQESTCWQDRI